MEEPNTEVEVKIKKKRGRKKNIEKWKYKMRWAARTAHMAPHELKIYNKRSRRYQKYAKLGQLKNGVFLCKSGKPIDWERVCKYEKMCHHIIRLFVPALNLWEASFMYEDLVNQLLREVYLALLNGFDPKKAMTSTDKDPKKRAAREQLKRDNPAEALEQAEKNIVYGRLEGFMIRTTWRFHPDQWGGRTNSLDHILDGINQEVAHGLFVNANENTDAEQFRTRLLDILDKQGPEAAKNAFFALPPNTREAVIEMLGNSAIGKWASLDDPQLPDEDAEPPALEKNEDEESTEQPNERESEL